MNKFKKPIGFWKAVTSVNIYTAIFVLVTIPTLSFYGFSFPVQIIPAGSSFVVLALLGGWRPFARRDKR